MYERLKKIFTTQPWLGYLGLGVIAVILFGYLQAPPTFADPDAFYHAKMARLLIDRGVVTEFPWLTATTLRYAFVDHHILYHLVLLPFVVLFDPLVGLKIATVILAASFVLVLYWFLRRLNVRAPWWFSLFILTVGPFIFRLNLGKAQALVLMVLFLGLTAVIARWPLTAFAIGALYVSLYAGWLVLVGLAGIFAVVSWLGQRQNDKKLRLFGRRPSTGKTVLTVLSLIGGTIVGIFFSPYFPANIGFFWQQAIQIGLVNYQQFIGVGYEWYPYPLPALVADAAPFCLFLVVSTVTFFFTARRQSPVSWFFALATATFFVLTLKSRRNIEYLVPIGICFGALVLSNAYERFTALVGKRFAQRLTTTVVVIILVGLVPVFVTDLSATQRVNAQGFSYQHLAGAAQWLKANTPPGSIVFHSDWDEFPFLFYWNDQNYYLVGLDPTFMYQADPDLYQRWTAITTGQTNQKLYETIHRIFGARYVLVDVVDNQAFDRNLANSIYFKEVYADPETRIYQVIE